MGEVPLWSENLIQLDPSGEGAGVDNVERVSGRASGSVDVYKTGVIRD